MILAAFVLISVIGLMFEYQGQRAKQVYRWTFIGFQFLTMILLTMYLYSLGYVRSIGTKYTQISFSLYKIMFVSLCKKR